MRCIALAAAERGAPYLEAAAACAHSSAYGCWQYRTTIATRPVCVLYGYGQKQGTFLDGETEIFCMTMFLLSIKSWFRCLIRSHQGEQPHF